MEERDIVGFPNGSMLLRRAQPKDSGTYHVVVTINPSWTMRAKTDVQVAGECWVLGEDVGALSSYHVQPLPPFNTYCLSTYCVPGPENIIYFPHALINKISIECLPYARH